MDGTLIGNATPLDCLQTLLAQINMMEGRRIFDDTTPERMKTALANGLARPGFASFYAQVMASNEHAEFFVYTAAEADWTAMVIGAFEEVVGVAFNRPIFSRKYCNTYKGVTTKRIDLILPVIHDRLRVKYAACTKETIQENMMVIDDTPGMFAENPGTNVIVCPAYRYTHHVDYAGELTPQLLCRYYRDIAECVERSGCFVPLPPFSGVSGDLVRVLRDHYSLSCALEEDNKRDTFWHDFERLYEMTGNAKKITHETLVLWLSVLCK